MDGPLSAEELSGRCSSEYVSRVAYSSSLSGARAFIDDQGSFVMETMVNLPASDVEMVTRLVASLFCGLVCGISEIVALRVDGNVPSEEQIGACLPRALISLRSSVFTPLMQRQMPRLLAAGWTETSVEEIEMEHKALIRAYRDEPSFKQVIDEKDTQTSDYDELWADCARFPRLLEFCGGLASIFPNTSRVEADFSHIGREKSDSRKSLGDFSLEGTMQAKQYKVVSILADSDSAHVPLPED